MKFVGYCVHELETIFAEELKRSLVEHTHLRPPHDPILHHQILRHRR